MRLLPTALAAVAAYCTIHMAAAKMLPATAAYLNEIGLAPNGAGITVISANIPTF